MKVQTTLKGYFTKTDAEKIKEITNGQTFYNFKVDYSNDAGNCTLIIESDWYDEDDYDTLEEYQQALKDSFVNYMAVKLLECVK